LIDKTVLAIELTLYVDFRANSAYKTVAS